MEEERGHQRGGGYGITGDVTQLKRIEMSHGKDTDYKTAWQLSRSIKRQELRTVK